MHSGRVFWITGLSGSGKTTLANALLERIEPPRVLLDGDAMRDALSGLESGYTAAKRLQFALAYAKLCKLVASQGITVVCSTVSMFHEVQRWNRAHLPGYVEIFLKSSVGGCMAHDYKNVYSGASATPVVGVDIMPEWPENPDFTFIAHSLRPDDMATAIAGNLKKSTRCNADG